MKTKSLLNEGGVAGHMSHLYDNPELTFAKMKEIFHKASEGGLLGTEKTDGQNLFITYNVREGKAKAARNKGNIKSGGLDAAGLAAKFKDRGNLEKAFNDSFAAFEEFASSLKPETQVRIFGEDGNIYYNSEIQDPLSPNVIQYDEATLVIHEVGHAYFNKETGSVEEVDVTENAKAMQAALENRFDPKDSRFRVQRNAIVQLQALSDKEPLKRALAALEAALSAVNLPDTSTTGEYLLARLEPILNAEGVSFKEGQYKMLIQKILGHPGVFVRNIKKGHTPEDQKKIAAMIKNGPRFLKDAMRPIEEIVHEFATEMVNGLQSAFVLDNTKEVQRLRGKLKNAISAIEAAADEGNLEILSQQMEKLKNIESVGTAAEGFVFNFDGYTYKFTGSFAPMNQILGLFKYGRKGKEALPDLFLGDDATKGEAEFLYGEPEPEKPYVNEKLTGPSDHVTILYPGGFKPPHAGHFELAKRYVEHPNVEKVIIMLGPKERTSRDKKVVIDKEASLFLWGKYKNALGEKAVIADMPEEAKGNPMRAAYKWVEKFAQEGEVFALAASDKDAGRAEAFAEGHCHPSGKYCISGVDVVELAVETQAIVYKNRTDGNNDANISASQMREDLAAGDKENFKTNLPQEVAGQADAIYDYLTTGEEQEPEVQDQKPHDVIDQMINEIIACKGYKIKIHSEEELEEMSSMAGGSVAGYAGGGKKKGKKQTNYIRRGLKEDAMNLEEQKLRQLIRNKLKKRAVMQEQEKLEEQKLRQHIRKLIIQEAADENPTRSTGINKLVGTLKIILKTIERGYKGLATSSSQRESYKKHLIKAMIDTLSPHDALMSFSADESEEDDLMAEPDMALQELKMDVDDDPVADSPLGIDPSAAEGEELKTPAEKEAEAAAEEEEVAAADRKKKEGYKDVDGGEQLFPEIPGLDLTGRDEAVDIYKKVIDAVTRQYARLHDEDDRKHYKDYLVTNLLLHFDKWENDISGELGDISTPEYERQSQAAAEYSPGAEAEALQEAITKAIIATITKSS